MKKTGLLYKTLPAFALALALGACGGGGDDSSPNPNNPNPNNPSPPQTASIIACFTAGSTVNFAIASSNVPAGQVGPTSSTTGPMTDNTGQAVTGQMLKYANASITSDTTYWKVTSSGVTLGGQLTVAANGNASLTPLNITLPASMSVGQTAGNMTLAGFENLTLAGKTFANACHFKTPNDERWYAQGYGMVKQTASGATYQYNGVESGGTQTGSFAACYMATQTVRYAMTTPNPKPGMWYVYQAVVGPTTYKGQPAVGQTWFFPAGTTRLDTGGPLNSHTVYWTVTSSGITGLGGIYDDGSVIPDNVGVYSYISNASPGQIVNPSSNWKDTFIGFETITLAGKTFPDTCHIKQLDSQGNFSQEYWRAPGYGSIKTIYPDGTIVQYNGSL